MMPTLKKRGFIGQHLRSLVMCSVDVKITGAYSDLRPNNSRVN